MILLQNKCHKFSVQVTSKIIQITFYIPQLFVRLVLKRAQKCLHGKQTL